MTSKGLFFKYMRENTKQRLWSVALTALLCFFLFPVLTALETSIMLRPDNLSKELSVEVALAEAKLKLTNEMLHMYSIQNAMLVFILIVTAVVLAASGFSYLHSKKKTDFFHSLPISREMLYTVTCLDGILYLAVPYLVFLLAAGVMLQVKGAPFSWGTLLIGYHPPYQVYDSLPIVSKAPDFRNLLKSQSHWEYFSNDEQPHRREQLRPKRIREDNFFPSQFFYHCEPDTLFR